MCSQTTSVVCTLRATEKTDLLCEQPIRVLYIAGWGHSGSTLLDLLLGSSSQVTSVGEIIFLDFYRQKQKHEKILRDFACTCGEPFCNCEFWSQALDGISIDRAIVYDRSHLKRLYWVMQLLLYAVHRRLFPHCERRWKTGADQEVFAGVLRASTPGVFYICDSSKDFARLSRLLMTPGIEVTPIFLVRDGRAVASSYSKKKREELGFSRVSFVRALLLWISVNVITRFVLCFSKNRPIHISYDLFCQTPERYIQYLNSQLNLNLSETEYLRDINSGVYHNVGGNLMRFKKLEQIRYDATWKNALPSAMRHVATVVVAAMNWLWVWRDSVTKRT